MPSQGIYYISSDETVEEVARWEGTIDRSKCIPFFSRESRVLHSSPPHKSESDKGKNFLCYQIIFIYASMYNASLYCNLLIGPGNFRIFAYEEW